MSLLLIHLEYLNVHMHLFEVSKFVSMATTCVVC